MLCGMLSMASVMLNVLLLAIGLLLIYLERFTKRKETRPFLAKFTFYTVEVSDTVAA